MSIEIETKDYSEHPFFSLKLLNNITINYHRSNYSLWLGYYTSKKKQLVHVCGVLYYSIYFEISINQPSLFLLSLKLTFKYQK